jgi:predicted transcriptional regulator
MPSFILSIHPQYVTAILEGRKTVECRKSKIGLSVGTQVYLYATSPAKAITGQARVVAIHEGSPQAMWDAHQASACVLEEDFFAYYARADKAVLLALAEVETFPREVPLATLRALQPGFSPPQTARRLSAAFDSLPQLAARG